MAKHPPIYSIEMIKQRKEQMIKLKITEITKFTNIFAKDFLKIPT